MGGNTDGDTKRTESKTVVSEKDVNEWLQIVIDLLAGEYGWTKDAIFMMYPAEVEILTERIKTRNEQRDDAHFLQLITAARVPHMKDQGQSLINTIMAKYKSVEAEDVTEESIKRELAIARSLLQR